MIDYNTEEKQAAAEAILFAFGKAMPLKTIAEALEMRPEDAEECLAGLGASYEAEDRGIRLIRLEDAYQLCTKEKYYEVLIRIAEKPVKPVLTDIMMEVLAIIAYKQPVTKAEIERIRGVQSDYSVNRLVEYKLVEEAGRLQAPGRPILFKTTEDFLRLFSVSSVDDLPRLKEMQIEEAREEAYLEAGLAEDDGRPDDGYDDGSLSGPIEVGI